MKRQYKYINEFNKQNYDRITILLPKGKKTAIKNLAMLNGESLNSLINRLLQNEANMSEQEWKGKAV